MGCDIYLKTTYNEKARKAIIIRLNMVSWVEGNMGKARRNRIRQSMCSIAIL